MSVFVRQNAIEMEYTKDAWAILNPIEQSIKAKIEKYGTPLKKWDISINYGIKTGCNEAFIITGEKRKELIAEDPKSDEIIRPILRGRDIKRYGYEFADLWLINIECGFTDKHRGKTPPEEFIKSKYPAIYKHFIQVSNAKTKGKGLINRDDKGDYWWELRSCAYTNDFSKQKIAWASVGKTYYSLIEKNMVLLDTNYFFQCENPEYLLAFLNSKLITFWINSKDTPIGSGGAFRHYKYNLESLSIPKFNIDLYKILKPLVDNVINHNSIRTIQTIDNIVYQLYHLTKDEINFIEASVSN